MTNRATGQDVRDLFITQLTNNLSTMLGTIDTERTQTTQVPLVITYGWTDNQYPAVFVDLNSSVISQENSILTDEYEQTEETFSVEVSVVIHDSLTSIQNEVENYIEAFIRIMHGYSDNNIEWVVATDTRREDLYLREGQTMKMGMVTFEIRVN